VAREFIDLAEVETLSGNLLAGDKDVAKRIVSMLGTAGPGLGLPPDYVPARIRELALEMTYVDYPDCIRWPVTDGTDDLEFMRSGYNPAQDYNNT